MSEKGRKKAGAGKARPAGRGRKGPRRALGRLVTALAVAAAVFVGVLGYNQVWHDPTDGKSFHVLGGEMKPVLDPMQFGHPQVVAAYAAAQQFPDVMDELYCYCGCDAAPFNHRSLLSCFTEFHGSS